MHLKKIIMAGAVVTLLSGSVLNVSAAGLTAENYGKALKESGKENLIIDVEAYKVAYSDLAEAFGDDEDAYIEHYLTKGVYEGRTKGVLFDPLAYAEAYGDVKAAFGDDISAIVNHYVTFGVVENRTMGTANGYKDIAAAEKAGSPRIVVQRKGNSVNGYNVQTVANVYGIDANASGNGSDVADGGKYENSMAGDGINPIDNSNSGSNVTASASNTASVGGGMINTPVASSPVGSSVSDEKNYHHTTSIYTNDESTLLRVEYYDDNNKLFEYSQVTDYDKDSNSYTENVYRYDEENDVQVPTRTDTYVNGELVSSEKH